MDMIIPLLKMKILLESNPLKSRILVRRLAVQAAVSATRVSVRTSLQSTERLPSFRAEPLEILRRLVQ